MKYNNANHDYQIVRKSKSKLFDGNKKYQTCGFKTYDSSTYMLKSIEEKMNRYYVVKHEGIEQISNLEIRGANKFRIEKENVMDNYDHKNVIFERPKLTEEQ